MMLVVIGSGCNERWRIVPGSSAGGGMPEYSDQQRSCSDDTVISLDSSYHGGERVLSSADWVAATQKFISYMNVGQSHAALCCAEIAQQIAEMVFNERDFRQVVTLEILGAAHMGVRKFALAAQCYERALDLCLMYVNDPETKAHLQNQLGIAAWHMEDYQGTERHAKSALRLLSEAEHAPLSLKLMIMINLTCALTEEDRVEEADMLLTEILDMARDVKPNESGELLEGLDVLVDYCLQKNIPQEGAIFAEQALFHAARVSADPAELVPRQIRFANCLYHNGRFDEALDIFKIAIESAKKSTSFNRRFCDELRVQMASVLKDLGRPDNAERIVYKLWSRVREQGGEPLQDVALALHAAEHAIESFKLPDAMRMVNCAQRSLITTMGERWQEICQLPHEEFEAAAVDVLRGSQSDALSELMNGLSLLGHSFFLEGTLNLYKAAAAHGEDGLFATAEELFEKVLLVAELVKDASLRDAYHYERAELVKLRDGLIESRSAWEDLLEYSKLQHGQRPNLVHAAALHNLGLVDIELGDRVRGREQLQEALAIAEANPLARESARIVPYLLEVASDFMVIGDYANAEQHLERARRMLEERGRENHPDMLATLRKLIELYDAQGRDTEELCVKADAVFNQLDFLTDFRFFGNSL